MFKRLRSYASRNKYTLMGSVIILLVTIYNFIWTMASGEFFVIGDNKTLFYGLFIFRVLAYIGFFILISKHLKGATKLFVERLLAVIIIIYEGVVVFNVPSLLLEVGRG